MEEEKNDNTTCYREPDYSEGKMAGIMGKTEIKTRYENFKEPISEDTKNNVINLLEEDLWCVHKYLDDLELPRNDNKDEVYSIVGRIKQLEKRYLKQMSNIETMYLNDKTSDKWLKNTNPNVKIDKSLIEKKANDLINYSKNLFSALKVINDVIIPTSDEPDVIFWRAVQIHIIDIQKGIKSPLKLEYRIVDNQIKNMFLVDSESGNVIFDIDILCKNIAEKLYYGTLQDDVRIFIECLLPNKIETYTVDSVFEYLKTTIINYYE